MRIRIHNTDKNIESKKSKNYSIKPGKLSERTGNNSETEWLRQLQGPFRRNWHTGKAQKCNTWLEQTSVIKIKSSSTADVFKAAGKRNQMECMTTTKQSSQTHIRKNRHGQTGWFHKHSLRGMHRRDIRLYSIWGSFVTLPRIRRFAVV